MAILPFSSAPGKSSGGTVTQFFFANANGINGTVETPTTTPILTLTLGNITPTTVNGLTISSTSGTFTLAAAKTLTANNTLTLTGIDGSTISFGSGGTVAYTTTPTFITNITTPLVIGGTGTTSTLALRSTSGAGAAGADIIFQTGNNGATEVGRFLNNGNFGLSTSTPSNLIGLGNAAAQKIAIETSLTDIVGRNLTVSAGSTVAGTAVNNVAGGNLILSAGDATGNAGSSILFQTATVASSSKLLQSSTTRATLRSSGNSAYFGVGVATPTFPIDVVTDASGNGFQIAGTGGTLQFSQGGVLTALVIANSTVPFVYGTGSGATVAGAEVEIVQAGNIVIDLSNGGNGGRIGLFGLRTPTKDMAFSGQFARTIWLERHTTANTAGNNFTIQAGGATAAATNKNGGALILSGGISTGSGSGRVQISTFPTTAGSTSDNTATQAALFYGDGSLEIGINSTPWGKYRLAITGGTSTAITDWALTSGWGANATISAVSGNDTRGTVTVTTSVLDTPGLNPVITLTFKDLTWTTTPFSVANMNGASTGTMGGVSSKTTVTTLVLTPDFTPAALTSATYIINYMVLG